MRILVFIILFISVEAFCQTIHGVKSGIDSSAMVFDIKSKHVTIIELDSIKNDTIWTQKFDYLPNGYLSRFEEFDLQNLDITNFWKIGYHLIEFKYNKGGFLIDYDIKWDGPVNVPSLPDSTQITTKQVFKNHSLERESIIRTSWYDQYDSYSDTTIIFYKENGAILRLEKPTFYEETYFYSENELLTRIEYSNRRKVFKVKEIKYEYY